jgi:periplasmic divalent cation tolerance protein
MDVRLILTTCASREEGERIARSLVESRVAACVSLVPGVTSVYRWQDGVEAASEILLLIKTGAAQVDAVQTALQGLHSYEVPEFLVLVPESLGEAYRNWLLSSLQ